MTEHELAEVRRLIEFQRELLTTINRAQREQAAAYRAAIASLVTGL